MNKLTIGVLAGIGIFILVCIFFGTSWLFPEYKNHEAGSITSKYTTFDYPENGRNHFHYVMFGMGSLPRGLSFNNEVRYLLDASVEYVADYLDESVNYFQIKIVATSTTDELNDICGEPIIDFGMRNGVPFKRVGNGCIFYTEPRHTIYLDGETYGTETVIHEIAHSFVQSKYGNSQSKDNKEAMVMNITESLMHR